MAAPTNPVSAASWMYWLWIVRPSMSAPYAFVSRFDDRMPTPMTGLCAAIRRPAVQLPTRLWALSSVALSPIEKNRSRISFPAMNGTIASTHSPSAIFCLRYRPRRIQNGLARISDTIAPREYVISTACRITGIMSANSQRYQPR